MTKRELIDTGTDKRYVRRDKKASSGSRSTLADPCRTTDATSLRRMVSSVGETAVTIVQSHDSNDVELEAS